MVKFVNQPLKIQIWKLWFWNYTQWFVLALVFILLSLAAPSLCTQVMQFSNWNKLSPRHWSDWWARSPAKACTGQSTIARSRQSGVSEEETGREKKKKCGVGGCAECDVLVWSLRGELFLHWLPLCPIPWSPHTISVCRTSKDGSSPSCSPPSSSSPMWQLWREMRESQGLSTRSHKIFQF